MAIENLANNGRTLALMSRYESRLMRAKDRAMEQLRKLRADPQPDDPQDDEPDENLPKKPETAPETSGEPVQNQPDAVAETAPEPAPTEPGKRPAPGAPNPPGMSDSGPAPRPYPAASDPQFRIACAGIKLPADPLPTRTCRNRRMPGQRLSRRNSQKQEAERARCIRHCRRHSSN